MGERPEEIPIFLTATVFDRKDYGECLDEYKRCVTSVVVDESIPTNWQSPRAGDGIEAAFVRPASRRDVAVPGCRQLRRGHLQDVPEDP